MTSNATVEPVSNGRSSLRNIREHPVKQGRRIYETSKIEYLKPTQAKKF
jgi:hypothetical protein